MRLIIKMRGILVPRPEYSCELLYAAVLYGVYEVWNKETIHLITARNASASKQKQYRHANA